jgi:F0F1-type ATP synthase membrane subunit b/b'
MSDANRTLEQNIQRLKEEKDQIKEVTREGHEMIQEARQVLKELRAEHDRWAQGIKVEVDAAIARQIESAVGVALDDLAKKQHELYDQIGREFDKLKNIMLYGNEQGRGQSVVTDWVKNLVVDEVLRLAREGQKLQ